MKEAHGQDVIKGLAETFQQLYLAPGDEGMEKYPPIVRSGEEAEIKDLSHFKMSEKDSLVTVDTPEGEVRVVTLFERHDFVTFLQIIANRCKPVEIPDTQGASIVSGIINWEKIRKHEEEFLKAEAEKGNLIPDWHAEFERFTSDKKNYLDVLIVLSVGPYSNTPAESFGYTDDEWIGLSNTIRLYHECTHFVCRKRFPGKEEAVWDELVADAVGIYAALGRFDIAMEEKFLGIEDGHYTKGRLENYIEDLTGEEKQAALDELSRKAADILKGFDEMIRNNKDAKPFDIAILLEENRERFGSLSVSE
ncbi:MAG: hypothetical protein K6F86_09565 [Lachnospiraceae bacterium]|nr:hypothetical protein [Lachnospiraceae bacterium]